MRGGAWIGRMGWDYDGVFCLPMFCGKRENEQEKIEGRMDEKRVVIPKGESSLPPPASSSLYRS